MVSVPCNSCSLLLYPSASHSRDGSSCHCYYLNFTSTLQLFCARGMVDKGHFPPTFDTNQTRRWGKRGKLIDMWKSDVTCWKSHRKVLARQRKYSSCFLCCGFIYRMGYTDPRPLASIWATSASLHCHFQSMEPWDGPETQGKQRLQKHSPKVKCLNPFEWNMDVLHQTCMLMYVGLSVAAKLKALLFPSITDQTGNSNLYL